MSQPASDPPFVPAMPEKELDLGRLGTAVLAVALATGAGFLVHRHLDLADVAMIYMLCITAVATRHGRWAALLAAVLSVACLDFFFIQPVYSFAVQDMRHVGTFAVMLGVGWVVADLAERIRAQARQARERERHMGALYRLGTVLAEGGAAPVIQERVEAFLWDCLGMRALVLLPDGPGRLLPRTARGLTLGPEALSAAQAALGGLTVLTVTDQGLGGAPWTLVPMAGSEKPVGILAFSGLGAPDPTGLPLALAAQTSLGLERARLAQERTEARLRAEHEHLENILLSSVSHDLRTPLGTITGATTALLDPGPETRPGDQHLLLTTIHQESCRLERLVNNLLDLTKLASGQVRVKKEWVPLEEVVGSAVSRMEEPLGERPLVVELQDAWAQLDPVLIEQVLVNLLDNALKFSTPGTPLAIQGWMAQGNTTLGVFDEGPGFLEGEEERVFEKRYRGARATLAPGAGLGLAICKGIALAHGGSIRACNGPQGGARIFLTLPFEGAPPEVVP